MKTIRSRQPRDVSSDVYGDGFRDVPALNGTALTQLKEQCSFLIDREIILRPENSFAYRSGLRKMSEGQLNA